jgi:oxalate decarboxylase/phosphoglucose isomerase-like protein (cupin superfamily)
MSANLEVKHGQNFSAANVGEWENLRQHSFPHPLLGKVPGKLFLKEPLRLTGLEVSLGVLPSGRGLPFLHAHRENEELYIFVSGRGEMLVDSEVIEVRQGSIVRVAQNGVRAWRNTGTEDLHYLVIQAKAGTLDKGTITDGYQIEGAPKWK